MAVAESFTNEVARKLSELSGEKPTVGEEELGEALAADAGAEIDPDELAAALDELATVSVAVQVGQNAERGRMWRHSGLSADDAAQLLADARDEEQREAAARRAREAEAEELAEGEEEEDAGEDEPGAGEPPAPRARPRRRPSAEPGETQRVEMPMAVAGALDEDAIGKLVTAGLKAADDAHAGFEFVITARP